MSYLWQEFNIKTFPAQTLVFRDGVFCEELSEYDNAEYNDEKKLISVKKTSKIPVHIIYIGEIAGNIELNIDISAKNSDVFMDIKSECKKPAFLNIFIKNAGEKSVFNGKIIIKNESDLKINVIGEHVSANTGIFVKNRVVCYKKSKSELYSKSIIEKNVENCDCDISFMVIADENAKITMQPTQYICAVPKNASHSASIFKPTDNQIYYLRTSGMSGDEIKKLLESAFLEE